MLLLLIDPLLLLLLLIENSEHENYDKSILMLLLTPNLDRLIVDAADQFFALSVPAKRKE